MMRALDLDLVRRRPAWPGWVALIIGLALAADAGLNYQRLRGAVNELQRQGSVRAAPRAPPAAPLSEQALRELDSARRLLQELALPWEALFRSIEAAVDRDTALLAIEPESGKQTVQITGEARNYVAILNFMLRLERRQALRQIHLVNHQIRADVPEHPYLFTLAASWGGTP